MKDLFKALLICVMILGIFIISSYTDSPKVDMKPKSPVFETVDRLPGQVISTSVTYYDMIEITTSDHDTIIIRNTIDRSANSLVGLSFTTSSKDYPIIIKDKDSVYINIYTDIICYVSERISPDKE